MSSPAPADLDGSWRCFFCDEVFVDALEARQHFGGMGLWAACRIKAEDGGLVAALRKAESELDSYRNDDSETERRMRTMEGEHHLALRRAEELGYARGLRDAGTVPEKMEIGAL